MKIQKKVLITGASSGIGAATALQMTKLGYQVGLLARRKDRLEEVLEKCRSQTTKASLRVFPLDLTDLSAVHHLIETEKSWFQDLGILINNAGLARGADPVQTATWEDWDLMLKTNIQALFFLTHRLLPFLISSAPSHIVNLGSVAGRWTYPGGSVYNATKFAVRAFSEGLRLDLLGKGVRVTNIEPGMVETEFSQVRFGNPEKAARVYQGMRPLRAEDIAESIAWSISQPPHVNIQEIVIYPTDQASPTHVHRQNESS